MPFSTPELIKIGAPSNDYLYHWYIYNWIEGKNAYDEKSINYTKLAKELAHFINSLQKIDTANAPITRRGTPLATQDKRTYDSILHLKEMFDTNIITPIWSKCLNAPTWDQNPVWLHGDLLPTNILIQNGNLKAVIDFGLMGIGDPACDLIPAWSLFDSDSRKVFRKYLEIDDNSWIRGKGWALSIALIIIPYYINTNPTLTSIAKRMINEIISDETK